MSQIVKILLTVFIVGLVFSAVGAFIPAQITTSINSAIVYFLQQLAVLGFMLNVDTLFICMQIIINAIIAYILFILIFWLAHFYTQ